MTETIIRIEFNIIALHCSLMCFNVMMLSINSSRFVYWSGYRMLLQYEFELHWSEEGNKRSNACSRVKSLLRLVHRKKNRFINSVWVSYASMAANNETYVLWDYLSFPNVEFKFEKAIVEIDFKAVLWRTHPHPCWSINEYKINQRIPTVVSYFEAAWLLCKK